jgi:3-dehydroquinate dehydratase II
MSTIYVLNGPNLGRLGSREPEIYGTANLSDLSQILSSHAPHHDIQVKQTDSEPELMSWIYEALDGGFPIILNPAAFTHYSYALRDAVAAATSSGLSVIEVHISNPYSREEFRHTSVISAVATGVIAGFGFDSYRLALAQLTR